MRPPLRQLAAYRLRGRRPDRRHDDWLRADLDSRAYPWRAASWWAPIGVVAFLAATPLAWPGRWWLGLVLAVGGLAWQVVDDARHRSATRDRFFPESAPPELGHFLPYRGTQPGEPAPGNSSEV